MNDLKYKMLGDLGYSGSIDDRRFSFYKANGAVSNDINDAEFEWLGGLGFTQASIRDRWNAYLNTIGFGNEEGEYAVARADNLYFSPRNLFLAGEKGVWYDPSDLSTLFQDAAGTTPVTAAGQPVGLMLDKSKGLVLGPELVTNGDFSLNSTGWTSANGATFSGGKATIFSTGSLVNFYPSTNILTVGRRYSLTFDAVVRSGTAGFTHDSGVSTTVTINATRRYQATFTATSAILEFKRLTPCDVDIDNISVRELLGNHATQSTATSRPILGLENGKYYLTFDGVDDWLSTASIDFTGTDKMTVVAGVRKLSDVNQAILLELSAASETNAGSIAMFAPDNSGVATFAFRSRGTALPALTVVGGQAAPVTAVVTGIGDISGDRADIRLNRVVTQGTADQGTGNYGNYPLYIGRRGGTTLPFSGRLYGLVVRGAQTSNLFIDYAEHYLNRRTGAY